MVVEVVVVVVVVVVGVPCPEGQAALFFSFFFGLLLERCYTAGAFEIGVGFGL